MKRIFTLFALLISFYANSQSTTVVISQVYGGGGSGTATFKSDYVELHNISGIAQDISGFKLAYGSSAGNFSGLFTFPTVPSVIIPPGGYLLVANAPSTGLANLTPTADYIFTLNMSGTTGKIAFGNASLVTGTTYAVQLATGNVIDFVGYGTANESETSPTATLSVTTAAIRKTNGCTETNNNNTDFLVTTPAPRNAASTAVTCSNPTLSASPNISNINTTFGVASASQTFNLSASNLTPAAGNISLTPSAGLEISFDNSTFFSTAQNYAYTAGVVNPSVPIYVRIAASAPQGALVGATVTCSGGGAANAVVTVSGGVARNFYSQPTGNLSVLATWGDVTNGTGTAPIDFTSAYQIFNVTNRATAVPAAHWEVSGTGSKIVIGDGTNPTTLATSSADSIKSTTVVDILNNGTLEMGSRVAPTFGNLATGSTVNYNFNGTTATDTVKVNAATYHNLILKGGLKFLKSGITTVNGNLVYDATISSNGAPSPFSTISLKGDLSMINNAIMEDSTTGFGNRLTLSMAGANAQTINTGTSELRIFRLQRDTTVLSNVDITLSANSKVCLGNPSSGGLSLLQKVAVTPTTTKLILASNAQVAIVKNGFVFTDPTKAGSISATDGKIIINKSVTSTTYPGTLKFDPGSTLSELNINITTPLKDSITIANNVNITGILNLNKGVVIIAPTETLELATSVTVIGGSAASYVDGKVRKFFAASAPAFLFPTGQNKQFSPIEISGLTLANDFTVQYFKQAYGNTTVNPTTLLLAPGYSISNNEYWDINRNGTENPNIKFYYNATSIVNISWAGIAHFNGVNWDNLNLTSTGGAAGSDAIGNYISRNSISSFSPFTFGSTNGLLPIILQSFNGSLQNNISNLQWKTNCENVGDAFELQYSTDGRNFITIYKTDAIGNCNGNLYNYLHSNVTASLNYYRLLLKSSDGQYKTSNIVTLRNGKINFEFSVLPTFEKDQIGYVISSKDKGKASIAITNTQGQTIYKQNIAYTQGYQINYLNTNALTKGMYLITIRTEDNGTTTVKFIK